MDAASGSRITVTLKLVVILIVNVLIVTMASAVYTYLSGSREITQRSVREVQSAAQRLEGTLADPVWYLDVESIGRLAGLEMGNEAIAAIVVRGDAKDLLAGLMKDRTWSVVKYDEAAFQEGGAAPQIRKELVKDGQTVGYLEVYTTSYFLGRELAGRMSALAIQSMLLALSTFLIIFLSMRGLILKRIQSLLGSFQSAFSGNLTVEHRVTSRDEIGQLGSGYNAFMRKLNSFFVNLKKLAEQSNLAGRNLASNSEDISYSITGVSRSITGMEAGIRELHGDIESSRAAAAGINSFLVRVSKMTERLAALVEDTVGSVQAMISAIQEAGLITGGRQDEISGLSTLARSGEETLKETEAAIQAMTQSAGTMLETAGIINEVVEKTNTLSVNASIEAARAGRAGLGFAVVAMENRRLSETTRESANRISRMAKDFTQTMRRTAASARESGQAFRSILDGVKGFSGGLTEISERMTRLMGSTAEVGKNMDDLKDMAAELTTSSSESRDRAAVIMAGLTHILELSLDQLKGFQAISGLMSGVSAKKSQLVDLGVNICTHLSSVQDEVGRFTTRAEE